MTEWTSTGDDRLLDVNTVAAMLGKRTKTVLAWRSQNRGPRSVSVGGSVLVWESDLRAWVDRQNPRGEPRSVEAPRQITAAQVATWLRANAAAIAEQSDSADGGDPEAWVARQSLYAAVANLANYQIGTSGMTGEVLADGTCLVHDLPPGWVYHVEPDPQEPDGFRLRPAVHPIDGEEPGDVDH